MSPIEIDQIDPSQIRYSICTLVTDPAEYQLMVKSFHNAGFNQDHCEFIYVDNSKKNKYDAFEGLNKMITAASGRYIILCHQDIELNYDTMETLELRIKEVADRDPNWAILANAGGLRLKKNVHRIYYPGGFEHSAGPFPLKVKSVDEHFMLIRKEANLSFSHNLKGYHLYGTDICIQAEILGYNAWVIDFALLHKSKGSVNQVFYKSKSELISKYQQAYKARYIRTMCTILYISDSRFLNFVMNLKPMVFFNRLIRKIWKAVNPNYSY